MSENAGLQLDQDIHQQQQVWVIERIAWVIMATVIVAALAGFLGHGPYSSRSETPADAGYTIDYQRFERHQSPSHFSVTLDAEVLAGDIVSIRVGSDLQRHAEITAVEPAPDSVELDADFIRYDFKVAAAGAIIFHFTPTGFGNLALDIGIGERPLNTHRQFVLP